MINKTYYEDMIATAPLAYYLTLTFGTAPTDLGGKLLLELSDGEARQYLSYFVHLLNQRLFGQHYKQKDHHLKGFVTQEDQRNGNPHFNILVLSDPKLISLGQERFEEICFQARKKVHKTDRDGKAWTNRRTGQLVPVIGEQAGLMVESVYESSGIARYVLKDVISAAYSIGFLSQDGVEWDMEATARQKAVRNNLYGQSFIQTRPTNQS